MVPNGPPASIRLRVSGRPVQGSAAADRDRPTATAARIRPIHPTDHDALRSFYAALSDESRRTRFLGTSNGIGDDESTWFCSPDHAHREGFLATVGRGRPNDRIVGHVCVEPDGRGTAEVAIAVADELQGRGIGRALVEAAVDWARRDGFRTLTATMLAANPAIQRLLTSVGLPTTITAIGAGLIEIRIDLEPVCHATVGVGSVRPVGG